MKNQNLINIGIITGVASIIVFLLQALAGGGMMLSFGIGMISLVVVIAVPIVYIRKQRKENAGYITFGDAFKMAFIGLLIGGVISTLFSAAYINFVDPNYLDDLIIRTLEGQKRFMEGNMPQAQMEEIMRETEQGIRDGMTPLGMLKTFGYYVLFFLVLSLIFAAFLKVNPPEGQDNLDAGEIKNAH